jgi:thiol-disulfide isomerase/thioredoxin
VVRTLSTMQLPLGALAPEFDLPDPSGRRWTLGGVAAGRPVLVAFICNHCPFVKHVRSGLVRLAREAAARGVAIVAINSNDFDAFPEDAPDRMAEEARAAGYDFPYLVDESQQVARAYAAACTPDFFLFDRDLRLFYRGQMDGSRPGNGVPVTGEDLTRAIDAVLSGAPPPENQRPSMGCNIKWRPGNAPDRTG